MNNLFFNAIFSFLSFCFLYFTIILYSLPQKELMMKLVWNLLNRFKRDIFSFNFSNHMWPVKKFTIKTAYMACTLAHVSLHDLTMIVLYIHELTWCHYYRYMMLTVIRYYVKSTPLWHQMGSRIQNMRLVILCDIKLKELIIISQYEWDILVITWV